MKAPPRNRALGEYNRCLEPAPLTPYPLSGYRAQHSAPGMKGSVQAKTFCSDAAPAYSAGTNSPLTTSKWLWFSGERQQQWWGCSREDPITSAPRSQMSGRSSMGGRLEQHRFGKGATSGSASPAVLPCVHVDSVFVIRTELTGEKHLWISWSRVNLGSIC